MNPMASLSVDLDNLWSYQKVHGDAGWETFPSFLDLVVPRILELLRAHALRITFFVVGQDADLAANHAALRLIAEEGHEFGNHSYSHEPWFHLYDDAQIESELRRTEDAIATIGGGRPVGFRGPGYSLSPRTLLALTRRGYRYDASTLPSLVGPLARAYYFKNGRLTETQRRDRSQLFGSFRDGFRPIVPYRWAVGGRTLTELPVTTMPGLRLPIHASYLIFLAERSPTAAVVYFQTALALCRRLSVEPSILLHPLDFLDSTDVESLSFFPGMQMPSSRKLELLDRVLRLLADRFAVVSIFDHVDAIERRKSLRTVSVPVGATQTTLPTAIDRAIAASSATKG
jgi:hypothetical protein